MNFILEVNFITGFMLGFEWAPKGHLDEEEGYIVVDLGVFRFLLTYQ